MLHLKAFHSHILPSKEKVNPPQWLKFPKIFTQITQNSFWTQEYPFKYNVKSGKERFIRQKKGNTLFRVTRPTLVWTHDPKFFFFFVKMGKITLKQPSIFGEKYLVAKKSHKNWENCRSSELSLKKLVFCSSLSNFV